MGVSRPGQLSSGVWGAHTALIDWCENNYEITRHVAEFYNTLSNLPFMAMALYGVYRIQSQGLPLRFALAYAGMGVVGLGSFFFHASLKWSFQLCDELPMIWFSSYLMWSTFDSSLGFTPSWRSQSSLFGGTLGLSILTFLYVHYPNPVHHQLLFGFILVATTSRTALLIRTLPLATSANEENDRSQITRLYGSGAVTFVLGFIAWNIDNEFCNQLESARQVVGPRLGWILQGHSWWHLLTGLGVYRMVTASTYLLALVKSGKGSPGFRLVPTCGGLLPYVAARTSTAANGHAHANGNGNGHSHVINGNGNGHAAVNGNGKSKTQ